MFIKSDNEITYTASDIEAMKEIPSGNWLMKYSPQKGYYLESTPGFRFPPKIYGNSEQLAKRYLNTFDDKEGNVGVLLTGSKGTGKSVLAKLTSHKSGLAVIIITEPFTDENFKSLLSNIKQKCVVFVDEFEKVYYNQELQNGFLSILDGVFEGKKMFIFTSNEKDRVNRYMLNRPGRILYLEEYDSLEESIVKDVIKDNLKNKNNKKDLQHVLNILGNVTMDILMSLISEMNRYDETATEAVKYLNLKPEDSMYKIEVFQGKTRLGDTTIDYHPLAQEEFTVEILVDDVSKYDYPNEEQTEYITDDWNSDEADSPAIAAKSPNYPPNAVEEAVKLLSKTKEKRSEWVYLRINITECKVVQQGKDIVIEADNNMRYKFTKKKAYTYLF